jgi:drug/metabolite transporter (DMT)-like permease
VVLLGLVPLFVPYAALWNPAIGFFIAAGIFAPGIGRTLGYVGIERIGVARSVTVVNSSPIFASIIAVFYLGELWVFQNIAGTCLVILGVILLSLAKPKPI